MSRFGQLSYGQKERKFIGQPVEDIAHVNAALIDRYHTNRALIDELQIMESNIDLIDNEYDRAILRNQIDSTNAELKEVSESGAYEHAHNAVRTIYKNFGTNKGLQKAMQSRQHQIQAFEQIDNMEGLSTRYKSIAKQMSMSGYQGTRQDPETGEWIGGFNPYIPPKPVDITKLTDELLKGINASRHSEEGWNLASAQANAAVQVYAEKHGVDIKEITEDRVGTIVKEYLMTNPEAQAWLQSEAEMDVFADFTSKGIDITKNDVSGRLFSNFELKRRFRQEDKKSGESDKDFSIRIKQEYEDEIESELDDILYNIVNDFEESDAEYDFQDIMKAMYTKALVGDKIESSMSILSGKYAFRESTFRHDIRVNEFNRRIYDEQSKLQAMILDGASVQLDPLQIYDNLTNTNNQIISKSRAIKSLEKELASASTDEEREIIQSQIHDNQVALNNLKVQQNDFNRNLDQIRALVPTSESISPYLSKAINMAFNKSPATKETIYSVIEDGIYYGKTSDEIKNELGEEIINNLFTAVTRLPGTTVIQDFDAIYNMSKADYVKKLNKKSEEFPQYVNTMTILTSGSDYHDFMQEQIPRAIKGNFGRFTDITTGTNLSSDEMIKLFTNYQDIDVAFGGISRPGTSEPVFHVTVTDEDGKPNYLTLAVGDFGDSMLGSLVQSLEEFEQNTGIPDDTRRAINNYRTTIQGSRIPVFEGYDILGNAVRAMGVHNIWEVGTNNKNDPIKSAVGNIVIHKIGDTRYRVELVDEQGRTVENVKNASGTIYHNSPEDAFKYLLPYYQEVQRRISE